MNVRRNSFKRVFSFITSFLFIFFNNFMFSFAPELRAASPTPGAATSQYIRTVFNTIKLSDKDSTEIMSANGGGVNSKTSRSLYNSSDLNRNASTAAKIYFGGNEFHVVNTESTSNNDYAYLMAANPYLWHPFNVSFANVSKTPETDSINGYSGSEIERYLRSSESFETVVPSNTDYTFFAQKGFGHNVAGDFKYGLPDNTTDFKPLAAGVPIKKFDTTSAKGLYVDFFKDKREIEYNSIIPCDVTSTYYQFYLPSGTYGVDQGKIDSSGSEEGKKMSAKTSPSRFWLPSISQSGSQSNLICVHPSYDFNSLKSEPVPNNILPFCIDPSKVINNLKCFTRTPSTKRFNYNNIASPSGAIDNSVETSNVSYCCSICPVCKIDLSKIVYIQSASADGQKTPKTRSISTITPTNGIGFDATDGEISENQNMVLTLEDSVSAAPADIKVKDISFNEKNIVVQLEKEFNPTNNSYLSILIDNGTKSSFVRDMTNYKTNGLSYTLPIDSTFDPNYMQVKVFLTREGPKSETNGTSNDYKIYYSQKLISKTSSTGTSYTFDEIDPKTGVRVRGNFEKGSKLVVKQSEDDPEGFKLLQKQIDNPENVERYTLYNILILDPNGKEIKDGFGKAEVWLPVPEDFDKGDLETRFITEGKDTLLKMELTNETLGRNDVSGYVKFETTHFSPYALIDRYSTKSLNPKTGKATKLAFIAFIISSFSISVLLVIKKRNKKNNYM